MKMLSLSASHGRSSEKMGGSDGRGLWVGRALYIHTHTHIAFGRDHKKILTGGAWVWEQGGRETWH